MKIEPYLNFNGRSDEAIEFYKRAVGAKVNMLMRYKDCPDASAPISAESKEKVMHASLTIGDSVMLLSDGECKEGKRFEGISLALSVGSDAEAKKAFAGLSEGGQVRMPLSKTFFSSSFGMLHDRFGIMWMVLVGQ